MNRAKKAPARKAGALPSKFKNAANTVLAKNKVTKTNLKLPSDLTDNKDNNETAEKTVTYRVNPKIHFKSDVPENVQDFIRSISREEGPKDAAMLTLKKPQPRKLGRRRSSVLSGRDEEEVVGRRASVEVIVTSSEYDPHNLSTRDYDRLKKDTRFSEYEIVQLWSSFRQDFPKGKINRVQLTQLIKTVFPKSSTALVIENIFRIFDPYRTESIRFTDLLIAFSMSMKGSVEEKLHWAFKLYDKDGNGEIDPEEMEEVFGKLCRIVNCEQEEEQERGSPGRCTREEEEELLERTRLLMQKEEVGELKLLSQKLQGRRRRKESRRKPRRGRLRSEELGSYSDQTDEDVFSNHGSEGSTEIKSDKGGKRLSLDSGVSLGCPNLSMAWEVRDPERDCAKFDPILRARELFAAFDTDGDGGLTEEEFISGCMRDEAFVLLLQKFNGEDIWGVRN